jgi:hypothetical protein
VVGWCREWQQSEEPDWDKIVSNEIPAVAPVGTGLLADRLALVEQEGIRVVAFVSSCRDFADVRKMNTQHVVWKGDQVEVYGVPFFRSHLTQPGRVFCVAEGPDGTLRASSFTVLR